MGCLYGKGGSRNAVRGDEIVRHYDLLQDFYERIFGNLSIHYPLWLSGTKDIHEASMNSNRILADACQPHSGHRVLDAGCGLGGSSFWLAQNYGVSVLGISLSEANIRRCQELAAQKRLDHLVKFAAVDFMSEPFSADSFDVVWNLESFNYACPKQAYIRNTYRILKPGGIWVCLDGFIDLRQCRAVHNYLRVWSVNKGFIHTWEHWEPVTAVQRYMIDCGFERVRYEDLTRCILRAPPSRYPLALFRSLMKLTDLARKPDLYWARFNSFMATHHTFRLMQRNAMVYGLLVGNKPITAMS